MLVKIFFFFVVVGFGGLFPTTSAICGDTLLPCGLVAYSYPFYKSALAFCGYPGLSINCTSDYKATFDIGSENFRILEISRDEKRMMVVRKDVEEQDCPRPTRNFTFPSTSPFSHFQYYSHNNNVTYFYNCSSGYPKNVTQGLPCLDSYYNSHNNTTAPSLQLRSFAFSSDDFPVDSDGYNWFLRNCQQSVVVPARVMVSVDYPSDLAALLKYGFLLEWTTPNECKACEKSGGQCWYDSEGAACSCPPSHSNDERLLFPSVCPAQSSNKSSSQSQGTSICPGATHTHLKIVLGMCFVVGGLLVSSMFKLILFHWKSKVKSQANVEAFLESCGCFGLQRYKYSQVKKITNTFKEKLGQGGFGMVYKGKLSDGRFVAVKVLNISKGNGEDFMNEVATIGWTNHVNVVRLLGFCSDGNKQALVYEYMVNGSLEKFIYDQKNVSIKNPSLGYEKLYQISLGIAKGLEYLHCGCNNRILHFDIKPHNILLDENFFPKISDFGLAKFCQTRESTVSMHVARGTVGYTAPEISCINFGKVSHKSDVYSYGMMVFEMIAGRKNIDVTVENISEIFFPQWIYNHLKREIDNEVNEDLFTEAMTRKMIIVALWCIQIQPSDRPSISKVVEMLEGNGYELQIPPNPFQ